MSAPLPQSNAQSSEVRPLPAAAPAITGTSDFAIALPLKKTAWIAAGFCAAIGAYMLYQHVIAAERDPWKSPQLLALKEKLRAAPADEFLRHEIRRLDLEFRQRYFRRLALNVTGGWLLVAGVGVSLIAATSARRLTLPVPCPRLRTDVEVRALQAVTRARWSVASFGALTAAGLLAVAFTSPSPLLDRPDAKNQPTPGEKEVVPELGLWAAFQTNWPRFRGPDGGGASRVEGNGKAAGTFAGNVLWKSPVPAPGFNSPVLWGDRVFLSGGDAQRREVLCYDASDGKLLWRRAVEKVAGSPVGFPEIPDATGYAASTMATDGRRAYALFPNGDLAAFNFDGNLAWARHLGVPKNQYGHASSLAIWPGKLVVQLDQDEGAPGGSKLLALDGATGRTLWESSKPTHGSWASPIIGDVAGQTQIITLALPFVMSFALSDGAELWRAELLEGEITPSPIFVGGLIIVVSPSSKLCALRSDGAGDVTKSHLVWTTEENVPDVTSPVGSGELVFTVTSSGLLTSFTVADGKKVWQQELALAVQSSPAILDNQLLVLGTKGELLVIEVAKQFRELSRTKFADTFHASPALAGGRVYLRGATNLWCLAAARKVVE